MGLSNGCCAFRGKLRRAQRRGFGGFQHFANELFVDQCLCVIAHVIRTQMPSTFTGALFSFVVVAATALQGPDAGYSREQLQPLTKFRQQHRRAIDGRLCAAAFVQNRKAYTGCTDSPNPAGESGRPWCYVEPQVGSSFFLAYVRRPMFFL